MATSSAEPFPNSPDLLARLLSARTTSSIKTLLDELPVVKDDAYTWTAAGPGKDWQPGKLHWVPIGRDRGNAGRIQLAGDPYNPLAERLVNGMEAIIEEARLAELQKNSNSLAPVSPRAAIERYFQLPRLDAIPRIKDKDQRSTVDRQLKDIRRRLLLRLEFDKKSKELSVEIRDRGIGQPSRRIHETLLSLGQTDKADKPYLIGVFGQGGSSTYAASTFSIVMSRRADRFLAQEPDRIGWTIVRKISPKGRRDPFYAYLASSPEGEVPFVGVGAVNSNQFEHGTSFRHIGYDFGRQGSAVARTLFYALNHVLFNPVMPYDLYAMKDKPDPMNGNAYRLARMTVLLDGKSTKSVLDKPFQPQIVT